MTEEATMTEVYTPSLFGSSLTPACEKCKGYLGCSSPYMEHRGEGKLKILIVSEFGM